MLEKCIVDCRNSNCDFRTEGSLPSDQLRFKIWETNLWDSLQGHHLQTGTDTAIGPYGGHSYYDVSFESGVFGYIEIHQGLGWYIREGDIHETNSL